MIIKNIVDMIYNFIKDIEEVLSADSVVLRLRRSIQLDSYSCGEEFLTTGEFRCLFYIYNYFCKLF